MDYALLERLSCAFGASGSEAQVRDIILNEIREHVSSVEITPLGNIIAEKKGKAPSACKLMLSAHMDEVALTVNDIDEEGFLCVLPVGGIDSSVLLGKSVVLNGSVYGVIGGKPVHLMSGEEKQQAVPMDKLRVDIGAAGRQEAEKVAGIGDIIYFEPYFQRFEGRIKGKALDDRVGCLILIELIKSDLEFDTWFCFSVQEEVGMRGAATAANIVKPQAVIAVEGTVAGDVLDIKGSKAVTKMGKGPAVSLVDGGTVYDRQYVQLAFETAKELGIDCQARTGAAGANDAGAMHRAAGGARAMAISVPCRYIHCPVSIASESDIEGGFKLLKAIISKIGSSTNSGV